MSDYKQAEKLASIGYAKTVFTVDAGCKMYILSVSVLRFASEVGQTTQTLTKGEKLSPLSIV